MRAMVFALSLTIPAGTWPGADAPVPCPGPEILAGAGNRPVKLPAGCAPPEAGYFRSVPAEGRLGERIENIRGELEMERAEVIRLRQQLLLGADALRDCGNVLDLSSAECPPCECHAWIAAGGACAACAGLTLGTAFLTMEAR